MTTQKANPWEVDYEANKTILDLESAADVDTFVFVAVYRPDLWGSFIEPREQFASELEESALEYTIVRPTGYFSDTSKILDMARRGRVYLVGDGTARMNPIHGADLAHACVEAVDNSQREIVIGGPDVFTYNEIAELAFRALEKSPSVIHLPKWLVTALLRIVSPVKKRQAALGLAFSEVFTTDVVAPKSGSHTLATHFETLATRQ